MKNQHSEVKQSVYLRIVLLLIVMIIPSGIIAQGWQTTWDTGKKPDFAFVTAFDYFDKFTAYADKDGIHVLTNAKDGGSYTTIYYLFDDTGNLVRTTNHGTMVAAELSGFNNTIVIIYIDNTADEIKGKKSTNAGQSWSSITAQDMEGTAAQYYLTAAVDADGIHVAHDDANGAYYRLYDIVVNSWTNLGEMASTGETPWVATSSVRAHFAYDDSQEDVQSRSYNHSSDSWETERVVNSSIILTRRSIIVDASKEYVFYTRWDGAMAEKLYTKNRVINGSTFGTEEFLNELNFGGVSPYLTDDGVARIIYEGVGIKYRYRDSGNWSAEEDIDGNNSLGDQVELIGAGNDLYAIWLEDDGFGTDLTMRIRWKDEAPVAPKNISTQSHADGILVSWDRLDIPDLKEYKIYRNGSLKATVGKNVTSWVDCQVDAGGPQTFYYKLKAKDDGNKLSPFSSVSSISGSWGGCGAFKIAHKGSGNVPDGFSLRQNVPNPFNPVTNISFDIPNITDVEIKVYDLSGRLVRLLLDHRMNAGTHELIWNSTDDSGNLSPSGIYIYRLRAIELESGEEYHAVRKMTLLR